MAEAASALRYDISSTSTTLVNQKLVRAWLIWALVWLMMFPLVGVVVSLKMHQPEFLDAWSWLTFGRLRPVHVNGVIFGAFSTAFIGMVYYVVPKLCGRPMAQEHWGRWQLAVWNIFIVGGVISVLAGYNAGYEVNEMAWPFKVLRWLVIASLTGQVLVTVFKRREGGLYVSLWYIMAALVWTTMNLILGDVVLQYMPMAGVNNANFHGLYLHYIVGLWVTPAGLALIYYFLPLSVNNTLYSHRLSLLGFWALALYYPFVGTHHYLHSPIPYAAQTHSIVTSVLLIIPVWTVTVNFFGTALGRWHAIAGGKDGDAYAAKFLLLGALYYLLGCFQGSVEALRRMQELTHFNDFVISHSHFTVFGTFVLWVFGALYYLWPRLVGRQLLSPRLASWHLWLTIAGSTVMFLGLIVPGFVQGSMLEYSVNFMDSVNEMKPWWFYRTLFGATMDVGILLMTINFIKTARHGKPFQEPQLAPGLSEATPAGEKLKGWLSRPTTYVLVAGVGLFMVAVVVQGVLPAQVSETSAPQVMDATTGIRLRVSDYTPLEKRGREVYIREGCWYCHSQYVRPVTRENLRWGPVAQAGEYVYDRPHLFGTRRIGPDLLRIGRKVDDGWHAAHLWNPRDVVPDSVMPRFTWLFKETAGKEDLPELTEDGKALIAYLQRLGTHIGDWRATFVSGRITAGMAVVAADPARRTELLRLGKTTYERRCSGCHGLRGDGNGPAAPFMNPKPRNFTTGVFKFHSAPGNTLPSDQDLFVTITHGLWGTSMPPWYDIPNEERIAVIQYIKTFSSRWQSEVPGPETVPPPEPPVTVDSVQHGGRLFSERCAICHGETGEGNGPVSAGLQDEWGNPLRPANFTLAAGVPGGVKLGHDGEHIFKTIMNGIGGTPMPSFAGTMAPQDVWDIVHYVQSLRVQAHVRELRAAGLEEADTAAARQHIWATLSDAARRKYIDRQLVEASDGPLVHSPRGVN